MNPEEILTSRIGRRTFLKAAIAGIAVATIPFYGKGQAISSNEDLPSRYGFLYDSRACIGCNLCQFACKIKHGFPTGQVESELSATNWLYVSKGESNGDDEPMPFIRQSCMHCTDAMCQLVCPVGAITKWNGLVYVDEEKCIGCGYCVQACPYSRPHRNEGPTIRSVLHGVSQKCDGCYERVQDGKLTACANACPAGALQFGSRDEMLELAQDAVSKDQTLWIYGLNELGGLGILYLFPKDFDPIRDGIFPDVTSGYTPAAKQGLPILAAAAVGGLALQAGLKKNGSVESLSALESVEESTEPVEESTEPVEENTEPVEESTEPVEESTEPVEESTEPVEESDDLEDE